MAGRRHLCAHTQGVGVNRAGAFAEFIALPMSNIWRHSPGVDLDTAAIFDPFGNAVHTALSFPVLGEDVLITGAGPIGVMATAIPRLTKRLYQLDKAGFQPLLAVLNDVGQAGGGLSPRQRDALDEISRGMKL